MAPRDDGFSLIEVLIAAGVLATALITLAHVMSLGAAMNLDSRRTTYAAVLAEQKIEELRSLTWGFDVTGAPIGDTATDTAVSPERPNGGTGLSVSPAASLRQNTGGYVDYLDQFGNTLGGGANPPPNAIYIRRWSIAPLPSNPQDARLIQVLVTTRRSRGAADRDPLARLPGEARMTTVKTRKWR